MSFQASQAGTEAYQTNSPSVFGDSEEATVMGNVTMEDDANVEFEIQGPDPDTKYDQLDVDKTVSIDGASLDLVVSGYAPAVGETFFILDDLGASAISGQFDNAPEGSVITADGYSFRITYDAHAGSGSLTGGNDVALIAVPEPASGLALSATVLMAVCRRGPDRKGRFVPSVAT